MTSVGVYPVLVTSIVLFVVGAAGVVLRSHVLIALMSLVLMLNAVNLAFVGFACQAGQVQGQVAALVVLAVVLAEGMVGLALWRLVCRSRARETRPDPVLSDA